ncbi:hypothetical protein NST50_15235 [Paenibacillus sp. FSL E2-0202]|uniref:hypothetical protein n=1 Tax=Paenibacillus sp. FSL E2-0202 TaxID=2954505 RepID=UPI0030EE8BEF
MMDEPFQHGYEYTEKFLIEESKKVVRDPCKLHFMLEGLVIFYLRYMYWRQDAARNFILMCRKDIELYYRFLNAWCLQRPNEDPPTDPISFRELTLFYENKGKFWEALDICHAALHYDVRDYTLGGYVTRLTRLEKKLENQLREN